MGQTWQIQYPEFCDGASTTISYLLQGLVVDVESVTVPAGTCTALKFQSTVTWTDPRSTARDQSISNTT